MTSSTPKSEKMTAEQRARFIANEIFYYYYEDIEILVEMTAEQIKAAEDDAREEGFEAGQESGCPMDRTTLFHRTLLLTGIEEGFADAVEKAVEIAGSRVGPRDEAGKSCCASTAQFIGRDIRALRPAGSEEASDPYKSIYQKGRNDALNDFQIKEQHYAQGFAAAVEKAVKILREQAKCHEEADSTWSALAESYAEMILALRPTGSGEGK